MLSETGDDLVTAVIQFLEWLGFDNVVDMDNQDGKELKEEDIQIETAQGLIIIEVKGIGGTSKDTDCSQIAKVRYRRQKERKRLDVYPHYLVNHQRHLPPLDRRNPPFTKEQLSDATNDDRGLITTWQLFNLFFYIEDGLITKEAVRAKFYEHGLFDLKPKCIFLDTTVEVFQNGLVIILNINGTKVSVGDELIIEKNQKLSVVTIKSIRLNDKDVLEVENGEIGVKVSGEVKEKSNVYLKLKDE